MRSQGESMDDYTVVSAVAPALWDSYVETRPEATSYHRYAWGGVLAESFGHTCHHLAALDACGALHGVLPLIHMKSGLFGNFLVSMPFVNYGGVLCSDDQARRGLLAAAERLRQSCRASHVELRQLGGAAEGLATRAHKVTMVLPLAPDPETQWNGFNAKLRNQVRKAEKNALSCVVGHLELLEEFYAVFARNMRDLGTPVYGKGFFRKVLASFPHTSWIFAVRHQGKTIAAGIALRFRESIEMPWASSISDFKALCPNNMLYWEAIRFAIAQGCTSFDFGRSTPNEGTFNFKKQWGSDAVPLHWQYLLQEGKALPELNPNNPKYALAIRIWQKLPLALTNLAGPRIVRSIP